LKSPRRAVLKRTEQEAEWFFRDLGGKIPEGGDAGTRAAALRIDGWLHEIPPFHRGVLALRYVPRSWPTCIEDELGELASVVVRLECALHPTVGSTTEALERASVERLREEIQICERARARHERSWRTPPMTASEERIGRLVRRAWRHVALAIRALAKARGVGPCVVPGRGPR